MRIRLDQLRTSDFHSIVDVGIQGVLNARVSVDDPSVGEVLTFTTDGWKNAPVPGAGVIAEDGLFSVGGTPIGTQKLSVDETVARTNVQTETFSFVGGVSLNLTDPSQGNNGNTWQISNSRGQFSISTRTDEDEPGNNALVINRTNATVDSINVHAPVIISTSGSGRKSGLQINAKSPAIVWNNTNAVANASVWDIVSVGSSNSLEFRTRTDSHGAGATWMQVIRSGTSVKQINFQVAGNANLNGKRILTEADIASIVEIVREQLTSA